MRRRAPSARSLVRSSGKHPHLEERYSLRRVTNSAADRALTDRVYHRSRALQALPLVYGYKCSHAAAGIQKKLLTRAQKGLPELNGGAELRENDCRLAILNVTFLRLTPALCTALSC